MHGNLRARATSKNGSAGVFRAPSESVMNARARTIHEPERPFPTAHSADSVRCNICSGMNSPAPGVEGLPARRPAQLPTPEHLHRVLQVIGILRVRQWPPAPAPGQSAIPSPLSDATPARTSVEVDRHRLKGEGELVHRRDLEAAEGVLGGFRHLGRGRSHRDEPARRAPPPGAVLTSSIPPTTQSCSRIFRSSRPTIARGRVRGRSPSRRRAPTPLRGSPRPFPR